ncbi:DNA/RNA non-specific endonuclease [Coprococcus sp. B2-R-112]|mgnify:FL=1|jgi:DNA-entry nuclease|uniref:DNA/RNA non-specific endonuclease n=1 Tax=Coprococcus sp. B2-R-112 TaxID=2949662 RepID=UPI002030521F|nr:DNA/RNA non-specific endonuclease [Coprococcus sp. B2-R-112]MCM0664300.1 DNA/RNA non-specific endonuclease [Coprococcus sp. B2-R-112]
MRSNKRNNKLSYFLTLLLCMCMLVGCGSGAATQVMLKAEDSETESYVETVQTESTENDPGDETEIQTAAETEIQAAAQVQSDDSKQKVVHTGTASAFNAADVPAYSGEPYTAVNNNEPYFTSDNLTTEAFENYSELDALGRCGVAYANVCLETMPTEKRGSISEVKPTGWHSVKYDNVDGKSLYNRCHLIGYQLTAENANQQNLITGTRYLNVDGMLPFENMVADYVKETDNHVLYRVTPIFTGDNLVADGVLMEGYSVEDEGDGICFCVYAYNVQPGITIDYATGDSWLSSEKGNSDSSSGGNSAVSQSAADKSGTQQAAVQTESVKETSAPVSTGTEYILNTNTKKFHYPSCSSVKQMKASNKKEYTGSRDDLIAQGYDPCKKCNP